MVQKFISDILLVREKITDDDMLAVDNSLLENTYKMKAKLLLPRRVEFTSPSNIWVYNSQLDYTPMVQVFNEVGELIITSLSIDINKVITIEFNQPYTGYIIIN